MTEREVEQALTRYEGLIFTTTIQIAALGVEIDIDDIRQMLRIKAWKAILAFDSDRVTGTRHLAHAKDKYGRGPMDRFVFMCVRNMRKDLEKRPRRYQSSVDQAREPGRDATKGDKFDSRYLSVEAEQVYFEVEEPERPSLPSTLSEQERQVVELAFDGLLMWEIDRALGLSRGQRERLVRSVREKMADWRPSRVHVPSAPLPPRAPQSAPARAAQSA